MKTITKSVPVPVFFVLLLCISAAIIGCSSRSPAPAAAYLPDRIIREFNDMHEHETVAWVWIRRGFVLESCRSITVDPLLDVSQTQDTAVSTRLENGLQDILKPRENKNGELSVTVRAAILNVHHKPGWLKKWFAEFDAFPYIEIELLISEQETGLPLVKIIHFRRDLKSLDTALGNLLDDLGDFFSTAL